MTITRNAIKMLHSFPKAKPWHLVVNFTDPHDPWDITQEMQKKWLNIDFPPPFQGNTKKKSEDIKIRQNYAAKLENIDRNIGRIIDEVKKRGELDNTIIIYTSDHGEMLGDFKKYGKQLSKRGTTHIPLVITGRSIKEGIYSDELVELQDLYATILDYAGIIENDNENSKSLRKILEGKNNYHRLYQISAFNPMNRKGQGWKLIRNKKYELLLEKDKFVKVYDLIADPWESTDVSQQYPEIVSKLLKELNSAYND